MKYRKKPIEVEAVQFSNKITQRGSKEAMLELFGDFKEWKFDTVNNLATLCIVTLEGIMVVSEGDWVIKGVNGEFYPCKPDIFEKTYEPVTPEI